MELLSASASEKDGKLTITLANLHMTEDQTVRLTCVGGALAAQAEMTVLSHEDPHACNTFENPTAVVPSVSVITLGDTITVPAGGVVSVIVDLA
jgi:alpha-L-arabinofuranosidase